MEKSTPEVLTSHQMTLVKLMMPIIQEYYKSASLSVNEIEKSLTVNIKELQEFMAKILADIVIEQNQRIIEAVNQADDSPYSAY